MKREVVQDFLNLPGIAGVALMDGRSRPYFCGVDQTLNFQQKEALAQGIQQVVETTPDGFEFFEFQFTSYQVYIHKLEHSIILLVLTSNDLQHSDYLKAVERLKSELCLDAASAIATFRLSAGGVTLSNQNYWKPDEVNSSVKLTPQPPAKPKSVVAHPPRTHLHLQKPPAPPKLPPSVQSASPPHPSNNSHEPLRNSHKLSKQQPQQQPNVLQPVIPEAQISLEELLLALNQLSQFATQYLGITVVTNYWKSTRPAIEWLNQFQVDRSAQITCPESNLNLAAKITPDQQQWMQEWTMGFIQRCSRVIRDFPELVKQGGLEQHQQEILLSKPQ
jgi:hypothetical protein